MGFQVYIYIYIYDFMCKGAAPNMCIWILTWIPEISILEKDSKSMNFQINAARFRINLRFGINMHSPEKLGLTCPLKINGWKMCFSYYWNSHFLRDMLVFRGVYCILCALHIGTATAKLELELHLGHLGPGARVQTSGQDRHILGRTALRSWRAIRKGPWWANTWELIGSCAIYFPGGILDMRIDLWAHFICFEKGLDVSWLFTRSSAKNICKKHWCMFFFR